MPPLKVNVTGTSTISRRAERAIVIVAVSSSGPDQAQVTKNVTSTVNKVQNGLRQLNPKNDATGEPTPEAAITHWSMSSLSTGSYFIWLPNQSGHAANKDEQNKVQNFSAGTQFEIKFRDFEKLGSVCTDLANVPYVQVRSVAWKLTDVTKKSLVTESRTLAVQDAVAQAEDFAKAAGKTKVWPVEIDADAQQMLGFGGRALFGEAPRTRGANAFGGEAQAQEEALKFQPEDVNLNCTVRAKFEAE
jgi:uncharacterized protein YggE